MERHNEIFVRTFHEQTPDFFVRRRKTVSDLKDQLQAKSGWPTSNMKLTTATNRRGCGGGKEIFDSDRIPDDMDSLYLSIFSNSRHSKIQRKQKQ